MQVLLPIIATIGVFGNGVTIRKFYFRSTPSIDFPLIVFFFFFFFSPLPNLGY